MSEFLTNITILLSGVTIASFAGSGLFFLRFWRTSRDRFFLLFGVACFFLSVERMVAICSHASLESIRSPDTDTMVWVYLFRLFAFVTIGVAIWEKNRKK